MTKQTTLESAIERRNAYQNRMIDNMVNVIYFTRKVEKSEADTQERVDSKKAVLDANLAIDQDKQLLDAFDTLIEQLEKDADKKAVVGVGNLQGSK